MTIKKEYLFGLFISLIVFIFFIHTLNYSWKYFDEQIIYDETILPIARSFSELLEYISNFGLKNYFEASNPFYSSISNLRCDPANNLITLIVLFFFKKNPFCYHLLSVLLHVLNTFILFLLINKISLKNYSVETIHEFSLPRAFLVTILTLLWALHPANVEPILFTTNWSAILTYSLCLILFLMYLNLDDKKISVLNFLAIFFLTLITLFTCEYSVTLPLILFFYIFAGSKSLSHTLKKTSPLLLALLLFVLCFIFSPTKENLTGNIQSLGLFFERIFFLSPQIFVHFLKLIFYPHHLSIDQTAMVHISSKLFDSYSIFSCLFMWLFLMLLFISFLFIKRKTLNLIFISFSPFIIALLPFLHIISPTYCLASERYLYFPLLMLIFGISHILFSCRGVLQYAPTLVILFVLLCTLGTRAYIRTYDWKDSVSLFQSALKEAPNDLFKGLRLEMLGTILTKDEKTKILGEKYIKEAIKILEASYNNLESEKITSQEQVPDTLKAYGLDPKTLQAKTAYLLAFNLVGAYCNTPLQEKNTKDALDLLKPHMQDLSIIDTQILDIYLGLLFSKGELDIAEETINNALKQKLSPLLLIAASELYKIKYSNFKESEKLLKKSHEFFPYDIQTLFALRNFYLDLNKAYEFAYYSYLYGIRTHSKESLQDAYNTSTYLKDEKMSKKCLDILANY